jgi:hypothetical protein
MKKEIESDLNKYATLLITLQPYREIFLFGAQLDEQYTGRHLESLSLVYFQRLTDIYVICI